METPELTAVLRDAGLSPYQADAYVTLLELGSASASDLAIASGVPGPRIYDILRGLEDEGYVITYEQDRLYARAADPAEALANIRTQVGRFEAAIEEIESRWHQPETHEHEITVVRRFQTVFEQTKRDIQSADQYVLLAVTPPQFLELEPALSTAYENRVHVQLVVHPRPDEDIVLEEADFETVCAEARRTVPCTGKPFVALIDHRKARLALNVGSSDEYGFLVDDPLHEYLLWFYLAGLSEVAKPIYSEQNLQLPITFTEIRSCIRVIEPHLREKTNVSVRVRGRWVRTKRPCEISGNVTAIRYAGEPATGEPLSVFHLAEQAGFVVDTEDRTVTVGGFGAVLEELEAEEIVVEEIGE
ncbi:TrmB family transcriptional regulator [Halegenticoccus soli]|uniref:TrmB family transcriptional regulator n=1 Tax=Halegenticoccus soli TaxID=1985678 RepID=UPI000C6CCBD2|nr:TrmB family transcriptional regulator [Halegenticoccus soli]